MMNTENMIDITGCDLVKIAKVAYELSRPKGIGFLHYKVGELKDEEAQKLIDIHNKPGIALSMGYVNGRAVKLTVFKDGDKLYINDEWYDHSEEDLRYLLVRVI